MVTIYTAKVMVPVGILKIERTFRFEDVFNRDAFVRDAKDMGYTVLGFGIDHLMTVGEALNQCVLEEQHAS